MKILARMTGGKNGGAKKQPATSGWLFSQWTSVILPEILSQKTRIAIEAGRH